jgi:hypothetical protein
MSKIDSILKLEDEVAIIEAIGTLIWNKKEETEDFSSLTDEEKVFVFIDIFEGAMGEGGLEFFFTSESGNFVEEIITSYQEIKAIKTAELISNAVKIFPKGYSTELTSRVDQIKNANVNYIKDNENQFGN